MTKDVKYRCNLCNEQRSPDGDTIFGINFLAGLPSGWLNLRPARECETHICSYCAQALHREYQRADIFKKQPTTERKE